MIAFFARYIPHGKLSRDIAWSVGSFGFLALSGILINVAVVGLRDAASLGVFNLAYAVYMVVSQFAVWGLHYSTMRNAAYHSSSRKKRGVLLGTALVISLVSGAFACLCFLFAAPYVGALFESPNTGEAVKWSAFGLALFPTTKVLLAYINALRHMRAFSVLQALRYLCVMLWVVGVCISELPFAWATLGFFVGELLTASAALIYLHTNKMLHHFRLSAKWARRHFTFGSKSLLSGMFVETNSRLDVLLIGLFLDDVAVGVYSFAAMLVDGLYHLLSMARINLNPILVGMVKRAHWEEAKLLLRSTRYYASGAALAGAICVVMFFMLVTQYIMPDKGLQQGTSSLIILLAGLTFVSAYIPLENLLMVSGFPFYQTMQNLSVVLTNSIINLALVPLIGIDGAALGTAVSYCAGIAVLLVLARGLLGWNLLTNVVTER